MFVNPLVAFPKYYTNWSRGRKWENIIQYFPPIALVYDRNWSQILLESDWNIYVDVSLLILFKIHIKVLWALTTFSIHLLENSLTTPLILPTRITFSTQGTCLCNCRVREKKTFVNLCWITWAKVVSDWVGFNLF